MDISLRDYVHINMSDGFSPNDLRLILKKLAALCGGQNKLAARLGVSGQYVTDLIHGKRNAGPIILKQLGLEERTIYCFTEEDESHDQK